MSARFQPLLMGTVRFLQQPLNAPLGPNRTAWPGPVTPDGTKLVYSEYDVESLFQDYKLFLVELSRPGVATQLNAPLPEGASIGGIAPLSPDSTRIAYTIRQNGVVRDLVFVRFDAPGVEIPVAPWPNDVLGVGLASLASFTPDSQQFIFSLNRPPPATSDLFIVDVAQPGSATVVNHPLVPGGAVRPGFALNADGSKVVFRAQDGPDTPLNVFVSDLANLGTSTRLNPDLAGAGVPSSLCCWGTTFFSLDGQQVIYQALQDHADAGELYQVPLAQPGQSTKLSAPLLSAPLSPPPAFGVDQSVVSFWPTFDDRFVVYREWTFSGTLDLGTLDFRQRSVVVERANPGVAILPYAFSDDRLRSGGFVLSPDSYLLAFGLYDEQARSTLMAGLVDTEDSAAIINPVREEGSSFRGGIIEWVPETGPTLGPLP